MKTEVQKLPQSLVEIKGEISAEEFEAYVEKAIEEYNQEAEIPGFRRGLTPEKILLEKIGEDKVLEKAATSAFRNFYPKIIEENKIEAIGGPEFRILKLARKNPLEFKIIVSVLPEVELPDYKKISREEFGAKVEIAIDNKEIDEKLEQLKKIVESKNNTKEELNDEFAKKVGNFQNLEELRKITAQNLEFEKKRKTQDKKRIEVLKKISEQAEIDIPLILIEAEKEKMLGELKKSVSETGFKWDDYLSQIKKSEQELLKSFDGEARQRVNFGLILREIAEQEKIEVNEEEVEKLSESYAKIYSRDKISRDYIYGLLKNEKTFAFLENLN